MKRCLVWRIMIGYIYIFIQLLEINQYMFVLCKISITKISCEIPYIKIFQKPINFTSTLKYHVFSSSIPLPPFSSHFSSTFLHHVFYPHVVTTWLSSTSSLFVSSYLASSSSIHQPIARSLSHPFHRCSLPLCYPFSCVNPFPSVSRHYRSDGEGGASFSPGREDFARPPPSSGSGTRWSGGGGVHSNDSVSLSNTYVHVLSAVVFRNVEDFMVRRGLTAKFFQDRLFYTSPDLFFPFILRVCKPFETWSNLFKSCSLKLFDWWNKKIHKKDLKRIVQEVNGNALNDEDNYIYIWWQV